MQPVGQISVGCTLGECAVWDGKRLWWTDIEGRCLHSYAWPSGQLQRYALPHRLASFGLVRNSPLFVGAFECGFALFDAEKGLQSEILRPEGLTDDMRLNDGRVDAAGRFWAGAMVEHQPADATARLYSLDDGAIRTRERGLCISNGLCWSPDGRFVYLADSARGVIWRYAYDMATGTLSSRSEFARTGAPACPDGAAVDADGCIWSAQWGGGAVVRYTPEGRIDRVLDLPVSQPTCVCFGGEELDMLFVTTARAGLDEGTLVNQAGAGNVLVYNVGTQGLSENQFNLDGWPSAGESGD